MAGIVADDIFRGDGQYIEMETAAKVNFGRLVELTSAGKVQHASASSTTVLGVAVASNRFSRTAPDDEVAAGHMVTVLTRGRAKLIYNPTAALNAGVTIESAANGKVAAHTAAATDYPQRVGKTLEKVEAVTTAADRYVEVLIARS